MGSPDVGSEVMAWLEDDDRKKAEEAIRSVRKRLTKAYDTREEKGVLETQRPRHIARLLAGHMGAWVDLLELMWAREHFVELGQKIAPFYDDFVKVRKAAKRGKKRYVPAEEELRAAFGEDWVVVRDAWPAVPFLVQALALRATPSMSEDEQTAREEACWIEAEAFLAVLHPNKVEEGDFIDFVTRKISGLNKKTDDRPGLVNDVLEYVFADPAGLRERLLVYKPRGDADAVLRYWTRAFKNAARDAVEPRSLGETDGPPVMRSSSTLRRWKHEDKMLAQTGCPKPSKRLVDVATENDERRKHRDPTGKYLTLTQVADRLAVPESSARNAVKKAREAGALAPQRLPSSSSYAFTRSDEKIIKRYLGARRASKGGGKYTIEAAAREAGVPINSILDFISDQTDNPESTVRPTKSITEEEYELLVRLLRERAKIATTGGSAKPRTS